MKHFLHRHFVAPLGPCLAEIGRSVFVANAAVAVFAFFAEYVRPGFIVQSVSPYVFVTIGLASAALALIEPAPAPSPARRTFYAVAIAAAALLAGWTAWYYFVSVPEAQLALAAVAVATVAYAGATFFPKYE